MADLLTTAEVRSHLNLGADTSHDAMIAAWIDSVTAHVDRRYSPFPSGAVTEVARVIDVGDSEWRLMPSLPVVSVTSITDGTTTYSTGFTISPEGYIEHASLTWQPRWTVTYVATAAVPADLKLAALEDIRGLYQPAQIGPPAEFGAFGIDTLTDFQVQRRVVKMWPRVDAWLAEVMLPGFA